MGWGTGRKKPNRHPLQWEAKRKWLQGLTQTHLEEGEGQGQHNYLESGYLWNGEDGKEEVWALLCLFWQQTFHVWACKALIKIKMFQAYFVDSLLPRGWQSALKALLLRTPPLSHLPYNGTTLNLSQCPQTALVSDLCLWRSRSSLLPPPPCSHSNLGAPKVFCSFSH